MLQLFGAADNIKLLEAAIRSGSILGGHKHIIRCCRGTGPLKHAASVLWSGRGKAGCWRVKDILYVRVEYKQS